MAVLVASRLATNIVAELKMKPTQVTIWSDSKIVLHWIRSDSILLKQFVGVRIAEIQSAWNREVFRYVPSEQNPADDLSRGLFVKDMNDRWIKGPQFIYLPKEEWPKEQKEEIPPNTDLEQRTKGIYQYMDLGIDKVIDPSQFSSWHRLLRITAYCLRFVNRLRKKPAAPSTLQPEELCEAERLWIKFAQSKMMDWEARYRDLAPFIEENIVKVGGRLTRSSLSYEQAHPILLDPDNVISKLIARDIHEKKGHPGTERTLCKIRRKYWIVRGRSPTKSIIRKCVIYRKMRQPLHLTLMADLPADRLKIFSPHLQLQA